jgi:hypothetical protein
MVRDFWLQVFEFQSLTGFSSSAPVPVSPRDSTGVLETFWRRPRDRRLTSEIQLFFQVRKPDLPPHECNFDWPWSYISGLAGWRPSSASSTASPTLRTRPAIKSKPSSGGSAARNCRWSSAAHQDLTSSAAIPPLVASNDTSVDLAFGEDVDSNSDSIAARLAGSRRMRRTSAERSIECVPKGDRLMSRTISL